MFHAWIADLPRVLRSLGVNFARIYRQMTSRRYSSNTGSGRPSRDAALRRPAPLPTDLMRERPLVFCLQFPDLIPDLIPDLTLRRPSFQTILHWRSFPRT